ncbi:hypothetical protein MVI01_44790 [Myxococcus virescens]|uniref:Uncharacterized protein n=1 Tax=Myxococcus virescens TaxID=83456 RepID=A0A511HGU4_9BACT|nr:hypothetical protein MVI01_44790 [Myxococcus virescens]
MLAPPGVDGIEDLGLGGCGEQEVEDVVHGGSLLATLTSASTRSCMKGRAATAPSPQDSSGLSYWLWVF